MIERVRRIPNHVLIVGSFALVLLVNTCFGELTYVGDGVGWDGSIYAGFVAKFCRDATEVFRTTEYYHLQRILPSAIVAVVLKILHLPCDQGHIINVFRWYNFVILTASVYLWTLITRRMELSRRASWLSAILLFLSFPVQKWFIYFPVLTDCTAMCLSIALLYCFLAGHKKTLLLVSIVGAFSWPLIFYTGLVLAAWPLRPIKEQEAAPSWMAALVTAGAIGCSLYCLLVLGVPPRPFYQAAVMPLSLAITTLLLFGGFRTLLPRPASFWNEILATLKTPKIYILLALAYALNSLFYMLGVGGGFSVRHEVQQMSVDHLATPGVALLANIIYFGPVVFFALYRWRNVSMVVKSLGFGMFLVFSVGILQLLLNYDPRRAIVCMPMLVACTAKALDDGHLSRSLCAWTLVLSFLFSKMWFVFNYLPDRNGDPLVYPLQAFMSHLGYMGLTAYVIHGAAALIVGLTLPLYFPHLVRSKDPIDCEKTTKPRQA